MDAFEKWWVNYPIDDDAKPFKRGFNICWNIAAKAATETMQAKLDEKNKILGTFRAALLELSEDMSALPFRDGTAIFYLLKKYELVDENGDPTPILSEK